MDPPRSANRSAASTRRGAFSRAARRIRPRRRACASPSPAGEYVRGASAPHCRTQWRATPATYKAEMLEHPACPVPRRS
jgi:hypothetical protein